MDSHVPPILPSNLEHRRRQLTKATVLGRFHQDREHVLVLDRGLLKLPQCSFPFRLISLLHSLPRIAGFSTVLICASFSSSVARITSFGNTVGESLLLRKVFTPMIISDALPRKYGRS